MRIAIIPARGGSKRIKNKNITDFCGKPLIAYSLEAAKASGLFDVIHVSTESEEIRAVVESLGFTVDFLRPAELADDHTPIMPVLKWVLLEYQKKGHEFRDVCLLMPTAPLLDAEDLREGMKIFESHHGKKSLLAVSPYPVPTEWAFSREPDGRLIPAQPGMFAVRSQDLPKRYFDTGTFCLFTSEQVISGQAAGDTNYVAHVLAKEKCVDIDDPEDLLFAQTLYQGRKGAKVSKAPASDEQMRPQNLALQFEAVVKKWRDQTALIFPDAEGSSRITFGELNALANQIARHFKSLGVRPGDVVSLVGEKTRETFGAMLAALKIGAPYSILDPECPAERLERILSKSRPRVILGSRAILDSLKGISTALEAIALDSDQLSSLVSRNDASDLEETATVHGGIPAYIMFTSGSTGFPKGAVIPHQSVLTFLKWGVESFDVRPGDVLTNVNPLYFDNSVFDFYTALFNGAALAPFSKAWTSKPQDLVKKIDELGCTHWFSTPSLLIYLNTMKVLNRSNMRKIRAYIFGGEGYPKSKLKILYDLYSDRARLFNVYGPTECTCICSLYEISAGDFADLSGLPPLGALSKPFSYEILDEDLKPCPPGKAGELFILGPNVGQGYYHDPELTERSFIQNPTHSKYREIGYRSGDLVVMNTDDRKLYFVGRKDHQIKHMGYRIELEEIEGALNRLECISEAVVVHGEIRGVSQILAVASLRTQRSEQEILEELRKILPSYMIPTKFFIEPSLPKNQNGKIDRTGIKARYF